MRELSVTSMGRATAAAAVARTCGTKPDFVVADNTLQGLVAARWRRARVCRSQIEPMSDHLLSYCVAGTAVCTVVADGVRLQARQKPGSLTLLPAGRALQWEMSAPQDVVHLHVYIPAQDVEAFMRRRPQHRAAPLPALLAVRDDWLENFFRLLASECERCRRDGCLEDSPFLGQTGELLIGYLLDAHGGGADAAPAGEAPGQPVPRVSALRPLLVERIEAHVREHLASRIRVEDLAGLASMSVDHFVRAFHVATGVTPHQYVLERRLDRACELLRADTARIEVIARACGFAGGAHFSMVFHQHRGLTPTAYRRGSMLTSSAPTEPGALRPPSAAGPARPA